MQPKTCIMMVQLVVIDPYAEYFVIFVYVLMDHLVVKTRLLQLCKKNIINLHYFIHNYVKKGIRYKDFPIFLLPLINPAA